MKKHFSFLCAGISGYWVFEDRKYYGLDGAEKRFWDFDDEWKENVAVAKTHTAMWAEIVCNSLNS